MNATNTSESEFIFSTEETEEYQINHYWMLKTFDLWSPECFEDSGIYKCFIARNGEGDTLGFLTINRDNQAVAIEVLPKYRNKGVGFALLDEANCYAPERNENKEFWEKILVRKLMTERPEMVESIIDLIMADTISTLVETENTYSHLLGLFIQSGEDIVENYKSAKQGINLSTEYQFLHSLVEEVINNIGSDLFTDMLDTDENSAYSEVLRYFGHGVSFWDNHYYEDFGFSETPRLKTTLEHPYYITSHILDKIADVHPEYQPKEDEEVDQDEPDNVTTFQIPEHLLSLIFNGDASGNEEPDIKAWEEFEQQMIADGFTNGHWSYPDNQEAYFSWSNDVHNLGGNVVDIQWVDMS